MTLAFAAAKSTCNRSLSVVIAAKSSRNRSLSVVIAASASCNRSLAVFAAASAVLDAFNRLFKSSICPVKASICRVNLSICRFKFALSALAASLSLNAASLSLVNFWISENAYSGSFSTNTYSILGPISFLVYCLNLSNCSNAILSGFTSGVYGANEYSVSAGLGLFASLRVFNIIS